MDIRLVDNLKKYFSQVKEALQKHDIKDIRAFKTTDIQKMILILGIETPDDKFGVKLQTIIKHYSSQGYNRTSKNGIVCLSKRAYDDLMVEKFTKDLKKIKEEKCGKQSN